MKSNAVHRYCQLLVTLGLVCTHFSGATGRYVGCGQGWTQYTNYCYLLVQSNVTWSEANSKCLQRSSELTSIHSLEENQFIFSSLPKNSKFWIGLESFKPGEDNRWTDNSSLNFLGFSVLSEALWKLSFNLCVYIEEKGGNWKTSDCQYISDSGYICKRPAYNEPVDTQSQFKVACTEESSRTCYTLYTESRPWEEAKTMCREQNQNLMTITDRQTLMHLQKLVGPDSISIWTGLSFYNGSLQWDSGIRKSPYPWISGEMVKHGCVALTSFVWETRDCNTSLPFMCQDRQDTSRDILNARGSSATSINSELNSQWKPGLDTFLTNTSKEILYDTEGSDGTAPGYDRLKSVVIREARVKPSCPSGWRLNADNCFKVINEAENWHVARHHCESLGADLPSIHSYKQSNFIARLIPSTWDVVWIGLHDLSKETNFEWTDGTPFDYSRWAPIEPNGFTVAEDCVELYGDGIWNDNNCYTIRPYVCVKKIGSTTIRPFMTTTEAPRCAESGWLYYGGFCYFISDELKPWSAAQDVCRNKGAELGSVHSQDENNFLLYQLIKRSNGSTYFWIGMFKNYTSIYKWSDESPVDFVSWDKDIDKVPAFSIATTFVCVKTKAQHALWFPTTCSDAIRFVCKKSNSSVVTLPSRLTTRASTYPAIASTIPTIASTTNPREHSKIVCPEGFYGREDISKCFYIGGHYSEFKLTILRWDDAKDACSEMSSETTKVQLASINSAKEQAFLNTLLDYLDFPYAWIGLRESEFGDFSVWQDNSPVIFSNWEDHYMKERVARPQCAAILDIALRKWSIHDCHSYGAYICEATKVSIPAAVTSGSKSTSTASTQSGVPSSSFNPATVPNVSQSSKTARITASASEVPKSAFTQTTMSSALQTSVPATTPVVSKSSSIQTTAPGVPKPSSSPAECPEQFQKINTFCYLVVSQLETWDEARNSCEARGADLAKTEHILQLSKMTLLLADYGVKKPAWIGIKQTNESRFHWTDGEPVRRFFWRDSKNLFNSPGGMKTFCVSLFDSKWIRSDCNEKLPYICQTKLVRPTATVPLHNNQTLCKDGKSVQHGDNCYLMKKDQVSWQEADLECKHRGMKLVSIHSNSQTNFIVNYTKNTSETFYYWIGLVSYKNGSFNWTDGSSMTYFNWDEDAPENSKHSDEECAVMDSKTGSWYSVDCFTQSHGYICSSKTRDVNMLPSNTHLQSSISGGGIAAIVIAVVSSCSLCIFSAVYAVRRRRRRTPASDGLIVQCNGFDNVAYVSSVHVKEEESLAGNEEKTTC